MGVGQCIVTVLLSVCMARVLGHNQMLNTQNFCYSGINENL